MTSQLSGLGFSKDFDHFFNFIAQFGNCSNELMVLFLIVFNNILKNRQSQVLM